MTKSRVIAKFLSILGLIYGFYVIGWNANHQELTQPVVSTAPITLQQNPTLVKDARKLGIEYQDLNIDYTTKYPTSSTETVTGKAVGVFTGPNSILIKTGMSKKLELNIVAYEYMHYIWFNLADAQRLSLAKSLQTYRTQNRFYNADVSRYHGDSDTMGDEMFATACTRVQPELLSTGFNRYCNGFIRHRSILF